MMLALGGGVFIYSFLEHSKFIWQAFGCEPTPLYAELANRRLKCNVINSYYSPGLHPIKFDLITVNKVLEHSQDPLRFLSGLLWDLNDNGLLYIEVPCANEIFTLEADHPQLSYDHLIFFTLDTLKYLAQRTDLDVLYMHEHERHTGEIDLIMLAKKRTEGSNLLKIKPLDIEFH